MSSVQVKKLGDKYILLDRLGTGGMAEVYRGKLLGEKGFEKLIVIKKLLPEIVQDREMVRLFTGEAKLAALLQHENITSTYDFSEIDGDLFLAMEYLFGKDLFTVMQRIRSNEEEFDLKYGLMIASKICEGMGYAHALSDLQNKPLNIIHRDLSPHNIFITYDGKVKILDFGVAKAEMLDNRTKAGVVKGKISYMSPEQLSGDSVDHRSDIFSIGILLYEMLSRKRMYTGDTAELIRKCITVEYEHLEQVNPDLPPQLYTILDKALSRDIESRYQSCEAMQSDIDDLLFSMSVRPDVSIMKDFIRTLFANEYESDQKKAVGAMEDLSPGSDTAAGSDVEEPKSPPSSEKTVFYDTPQNDSGRPTSILQRILAGVPAKKKWYFLAAPLCLAALMLFLFSGEDTDSTASAPPANKEMRPQTAPARPEQTAKADNATTQKILLQAEKALHDGRLVHATNIVDKGLSATPQHLKLLALKTRIDEEKMSAITELSRRATECMFDDKLTSPAGDSAYGHYKQIERIDPGSALARAGLQKIADRYASLANMAYKDLRFAVAEDYVQKGLAVMPEHARLLQIKELKPRIDKKKINTITELSQKATACMLENKLTTPADDSAYWHYKQIERIDPGSAMARTGLQTIADRYASMANQAYQNFRFAVAEDYVQKGLIVMPEHARLMQLKSDLTRSRPEVLIKGLEKNFDSLEKNFNSFFSQ